MIVHFIKRLPAQDKNINTAKRRAKNLINYITNPETTNQDEKCIFSEYINFLSNKDILFELEAAGVAIKDFPKGKRHNGEWVDHMVLSFPEHETPYIKELQMMSRRLIEATAARSAMAVTGVHVNTDNLHVHAAVQVDSPFGTRFLDSRTRFYNAHRLLCDLEQEYNLTSEPNSLYVPDENKIAVPRKNREPSHLNLMPYPGLLPSLVCSDSKTKKVIEGILEPLKKKITVLGQTWEWDDEPAFLLSEERLLFLRFRDIKLLKYIRSIINNLKDEQTILNIRDNERLSKLLGKTIKTGIEPFKTIVPNRPLLPINMIFEKAMKSLKGHPSSCESIALLACAMQGYTQKELLQVLKSRGTFKDVSLSHVHERRAVQFATRFENWARFSSAFTSRNLREDFELRRFQTVTKNQFETQKKKQEKQTTQMKKLH